MASSSGRVTRSGSGNTTTAQGQRASGSRTVTQTDEGYNVEWSQELKLEQSLEEYVKASMLLEIVVASGRLELEPGFDEFLFDD